MTYILRILRDSPIGAWSLDDYANSVFPDSSGNGVTAAIFTAVAKPGTDTITSSLTEGRSTAIIDQKSATDTVSASITDATVTLDKGTRVGSDIVAASLTEGRSIFVTGTAASDTVAASITDASSVNSSGLNKSAIDTISASVSDSSSLRINNTANDIIAASITDTSSITPTSIYEYAQGYDLAYAGPDSPLGMTNPTMMSFARLLSTNAPMTLGEAFVKAEPIVARGVSAAYVAAEYGDIYLGISKVFTSATANRPFSVEAWVKPKNLLGTGWLFKRNSGGIKIVGNTISFVMPMQQTLVASWSGIEAGEIYHVVGVYDTSAIYLYVNGVVVASQELTDADLAYGMPTETNASLSIMATGGCEMVVDTPAVYNYPLRRNSVLGHYSYGLDYSDVETISKFNNSNEYKFYDQAAPIKSFLVADSNRTWRRGQTSGFVEVERDTLKNFYDSISGNFGTGTWTGTLNLPPEAVTTASSRISWVPSRRDIPFVVEVSTDGGTSFTTVTNGSDPLGSLNLAAGIDIDVRVTIPVTTESVYLDSLNLTLYAAKTISGADSDLPITVTGPFIISEYDYAPAQFNDNRSLRLSAANSGASVAAGAVFSGYQAIELSMHWSADQISKTLFTNGVASVTTTAAGAFTVTGGTLYVDGEPFVSGGTISSEVWHHLVFVFAAANTGTQYIANNAAGTSAFNGLLGYVATSRSAPSASDISKIYSRWVGKSPYTKTETQKIIVKEKIFAGSTLPVRGYAIDWSPAGV